MKRKNQNNLFLIEITLSIFIFTCTAAICIQIFVTAYQLNQKASYRNFALNECQNISETWISDPSLSLEAVLTKLYQNDNTTLYYDTNNKITNQISENTIQIQSFDNQLHFNIYYHNEIADQLIIQRPNQKVKEK